MKRVLPALLLLLLVSAITVQMAAAQDDEPTGINVDCEDGGSFSNGVKVTVVQMRSGFNYTATAVGLNGFDPVLAVLGEDNSGLCSDDTTSADYYEAYLPTTDVVEPSPRTAQVAFSQNSAEAFADVSLVVGGFGDTDGEFILILEGMVATDADGAGDIFSVQLTPGLVTSEIPLSVYMISVTNQFDPLIYLMGEELGDVMLDTDEVPVLCDDAGNESSCWGISALLDEYGVSRANGNVLAGGQYDAMLTIPLTNVDLEEEPEQYYTFIATSYPGQSFGDYMMGFHLATGVPADAEK